MIDTDKEGKDTTPSRDFVAMETNVSVKKENIHWKIQKVSGNGVCLPNYVSKKMFGVEDYGKDIRRKINLRVLENRDYYKNKEFSASPEVPFERQVEEGEKVSFEIYEALYEFLKHSEEASSI